MLAITIASTILFGGEISVVFAVISSVVGYVAVVIYYMWCSEKDRKPWA